MSSKLLQKLETWMSFTAEKIESALRSYLADMHYSLAKAMSGFGLCWPCLFRKDFERPALDNGLSLL